jgi:hypothetical protein
MVGAPRYQTAALRAADPGIAQLGVAREGVHEPAAVFTEPQLLCWAAHDVVGVHPPQAFVPQFFPCS